MNAPDLALKPANDYDTEARGLVEWLFAQAAYYRKHAPNLTGDIARFEDAAALIDTYRAGLVLVDPHPAMRAELIRWVRAEDELPDADETVLLWREGDDTPWPGYLDGHRWRSADGFHIPAGSVTDWAKMPTGPTAPTPALATPSAKRPEVAK